MKRAFWFVLGCAITFSVTTYADDIVGKQVEGTFPVTIEDKKLDNQAIIIEGSSYLPVRAVGEALNMDVSFDQSTGIKLKREENSVSMEKLKASIDRNKKEEELKIEARKLEEEDEELSKIIKSHNRKEGTYTEEQYIEAKKKTDENIAKIKDLRQQIDALYAK